MTVSNEMASYGRMALVALSASGLIGCTSMANSDGPPDLLANEQFGQVDAADIVEAAINQGPAGERRPPGLPPREKGKGGGSKQLSFCNRTLLPSLRRPAAARCHLAAFGQGRGRERHGERGGFGYIDGQSADAARQRRRSHAQ